MPYRSSIDEIRARVEREQAELGALRRGLGPRVRLLPGSMQRELARLEDVLEQEIRTEALARTAERAVADYREQLDTALGFADHLERLRGANRRDRRRLAGWVALGFAVFAGVYAFVVVAHRERTTFSCRSGTECLEEGRCSASFGSSLVGTITGTDTDQCVIGDGDGCARPCELFGRCSVRDGRCVATSDSQCRSAPVCSEGGWCTAKEGRCIAGTNDDCRASVMCRNMGECSAVSGRCAARSDADCRISRACTTGGACTFSAMWQSCIKPSAFEDATTPTGDPLGPRSAALAK